MVLTADYNLLEGSRKLDYKKGADFRLYKIKASVKLKLSTNI